MENRVEWVFGVKLSDIFTYDIERKIRFFIEDRFTTIEIVDHMVVDILPIFIWINYQTKLLERN